MWEVIARAAVVVVNEGDPVESGDDTVQTVPMARSTAVA